MHCKCILALLRAANNGLEGLINDAKEALAGLNSAACRWIPLAPRWPASYACPMLNIYPASRVAPCGWLGISNNRSTWKPHSMKTQTKLTCLVGKKVLVERPKGQQSVIGYLSHSGNGLFYTVWDAGATVQFEDDDVDFVEINFIHLKDR